MGNRPLMSKYQKKTLFQSPWVTENFQCTGVTGQSSGFWHCNNGGRFEPLLIVTSSPRYGSKSFYNLGVRLKVVLHFKSYNFWLYEVNLGSLWKPVADTVAFCCPRKDVRQRVESLRRTVKKLRECHAGSPIEAMVRSKPVSTITACWKLPSWEAGGNC